MPLAPGTRLGHYDVTALLGEGGMGQVWQATDTQLGRQVALKILPDAFAADPDRLARFKREAQILASLNHPNIAAIYGIEEAEGTRALVLELVEGPTLADRISKGPIPLDEALPIAKQMAEALEAAHEAGVIHRDLKPANIKVREDGTVKVLDFGLAKALDPTPTGDPSESPTLTAAATKMGVIMGTAAYMSPEQARGKPVDRRADIWAFGVVFFEMLTGTRAFQGEDVSLMLSAVLQRDPDWETLPTEVPVGLNTYVRRCLHKDPTQRVQAIGDVRLAIEGTFETTGRTEAVPTDARRFPVWQRPVAGLAGAVVLTALITALAMWGLLRSTPTSPPTNRFTLQPPAGHILQVAGSGAGRNFALSPDGQTLVYPAVRESTNYLFRRDMNALEVVELRNSEEDYFPTFSPDGQWIAFSDFGVLKKRALIGGPAITLYAEQIVTEATWGDNDLIVFGFFGANAPLWQVPASGGEAQPITTLLSEAEDVDHRWPELLPGSRGLLFTVWTGANDETGLAAAQIALKNLDTGERRVLLPGSSARYVPSGHLVFVRGDGVWAVPFDLERGEVVGSGVPVLEDVRVHPSGLGQFAIAANGTLVYRSRAAGAPAGAPRTLVWVDREGREEPVAAPARPYLYPRMSPDGTRFALDVRDQENDIWLWDFDRETLSRLTFDGRTDSYSVWMPDGQHVIYRSGSQGVYRRAADGTGEAERLTDEDAPFPYTISPDGARLVMRVNGLEGSLDLVITTVNGDADIEPLLSTEFNEWNAEISPDGRWIAYESDASGQFEIYVRPFPDVTEGRWQVSTGGGTEPLWSPVGSEMFYRAPEGGLMSVPVSIEGGFSVGNPSVVVAVPYFDGPGNLWGRMYDVSPDGQRFLMIKAGDAQPGSSGELVVVQNWLEELKELVPVP